MKRVKLWDLKVHPGNPRTITEKQLERLKRKLKEDPEFLEARPIIVDGENVIWSGNQKVAALRAMGETECQVEVLDKSWTEEEKQELLIKDNLHYGYFEWGTIRENATDTELVKFGLLEEIEGPKKEKEEKEYEPSYTVTLPVRAEAYDEVRSRVDSMREQAVNVATLIEEALQT